MNGLLKYEYPVAESTGRAHENIDAMLDQNLAEHMIDRYETHGTIGPQPDYAVKPGKGIFGQPVAGMTHDALMEHAQGLAMGTAGAGPANLSKGILKFVKKIAKDPKELKRMTNRGYTRAKLATTNAVKSYLNKNKPYQQARQKFKEWDQPPLLESDPISLASRTAKLHTIEDIAGKKGLDRFFNTINATKSPMNNPRVRAAMRDVIKDRVLNTEVMNLPKTAILKEWLNTRGKLGGQAYTQRTPRARVDLGKATPEVVQSLGKHEFTHISQLQKPRNAPQMETLIKKHNLTGDEMNWLQNNLYDRPFASVWASGRNPNRLPTQYWEDAYIEKLYPHFKPEVKKWFDKYHAGKTPLKKLNTTDKFREYKVRAREFAGRGSQIRHEVDKMLAGDTAQRKAGSLLERLMLREGKLLTEEGIDMIVNKLWGVGPVGLGLSFQEGKAKK